MKDQIAVDVAYLLGSITETQLSGTKLVIKGGEYSSEKHYGMVIGDKGSVAICDGDVLGGTIEDENNVGIAFSGVVVQAGGELNMAGGSIKGGDGSESGGRGVGLAVVGGDDAISTATIVGGNIAAGTEINDELVGISLYVGSDATVNVWGGTLGSHWVVADGGTVKVYGKDLTLVDDDLKGRLCDGSPINVNVNLIEGGNVELMQAPCKDAPKFDECGKQAKSKGRKGSKSDEMFER